MSATILNDTSRINAFLNSECPEKPAIKINNLIKIFVVHQFVLQYQDFLQANNDHDLTTCICFVFETLFPPPERTIFPSKKC